MARLLVFLILIVFVCHVLACLWVLAASANPEHNWILSYEEKTGTAETTQKYSEIYMMSFYFITTTVTTVGYGDIVPVNRVEQVFCIFVLFIGVGTFSFAAGSLTSIITNYDSSQAVLKSKMQTIENLRKQYKIAPQLYNELKQTIQFEHSKHVDGLGDLMESLPLSIKTRLATEIYKDVLEGFSIFFNIEKSFLSWVGHRLVPRMFTDKQYIYQETE